MKNGFNQTLHPSLIPDQYEMIYNVGMKGTIIDPLFLKRWNDISPQKRGVIHQPLLSVTNGVNDNASAFLGLLNDLSFSGWNNGIPIIVDIWEAPENVRYNLDNIRQHGIYISEHYKPVVKPLLRVIVSTWEKWYEGNALETMRLLNDYEILLCQPEINIPSKLSAIGMVQWWEYYFGMYKMDETRQWNVSDPDPIPDPIPDPELPPVVIGEQTVIRKWKISLLGGLIQGTIEAVED